MKLKRKLVNEKYKAADRGDVRERGGLTAEGRRVIK